MIVERQVMAENKPEFVFASCQLVNVWAQKMTADERIMFVTEVYTQHWFQSRLYCIALDILTKIILVAESDGYSSIISISTRFSY